MSFQGAHARQGIIPAHDAPLAGCFLYVATASPGFAPFAHDPLIGLLALRENVLIVLGTL
jgi:hypothetical protein